MTDSFDEILKRHLKEHGSKAIEAAIKKAICDLTGIEYEADIISIDFEPCMNAHFDDKTEIKLRLNKKRESFKIGSENA
ncbi:MAG: hypothetical protein HYS23_14555 [Geobacter sp.]|nr:hypothetical protein [Geobacter sp.]